MHTDEQIVLDTLRLESNGVPIYVQIRDRMLQAIGEGLLRPGEQMPTMRQVAVALKVDLNTVRHAYAELERRGAINIVRAKGTFVAERPPPADPDAEAARLEGLALQVIASAHGAGIEPAALARRVLKIITGKERRS